MPSSGRSEWVYEGEYRLKCYLKSPPEDGKANRELVALFAKALRIPRNDIDIVSGGTSRRKRVRIEGCSGDDVLAALGFDRQLSLFEERK